MAQIVIQCNSGDCWADKDGNFSATGNQLYVVDSPGVTNSNVRTWIPFTVPLRNVTIQQAYITVRASATSSTASGNIRIACEAADNPSTPSGGADCNGRSISSYTVTQAIGQFVADTEYTWQIDNPVQETLQRAGWNANNTMAIVIDDVDFGDAQKEIYSYEGNASYRAYLTINYTGFTPLSTGIY